MNKLETYQLYRVYLIYNWTLHIKSGEAIRVDGYVAEMTSYDVAAQDGYGQDVWYGGNCYLPYIIKHG